MSSVGGLTGSIRVLHVDDEPGFAEMAATFLEREDDRFEIETATSADEGLGRLADGEYDCVVSDYDMPGSNGIDFLEAVRESDPDLPFVLFTGKGSEEIASDAVSAGVTDYLQKESGADQYAVLANRVTNAVERINAERRLTAHLERMSDAFYTLDTEWRFSYLNERAETVLERDREAVLGQRVWEAFPATAGSELESRYRAALDDGESRTFEYEYPPLEATFEVHAYPSEAGLSVYFEDVTERKERERMQAEVERHREEIYRIASRSDATPDERIEGLLELGCAAFGVENGHVAEIDRAAGRHETRFAAGSAVVEPGTVTDLSETFCRRTVESDGIVDIADGPGAEHGADSAIRRTGIERYVGTKLIVDDEAFGTLCFVDRDGCEEPLNGPERTLLDLIARLVSQLLERKRTDREREEILERMTDAVFSVDEGWRITFANGSARETLGAAMDDPDGGVEGRHLWDAIPEAVGTVFHERFHEAMEAGASVAFQEYYEPLERWFDVRAYPSETGASVYFRDITDSRQRDAEIRHREETLREVYEIISDADRDFEKQVEALLDLGRRVIGVEYGSLSELDGEEYVFRVVDAPADTLEAGDSFELPATNCERTVRSAETVTISDIAVEAPELVDRPPHAEFGVDSYVGTPIIVEGRMYGTFCFYGTDARREPFSEWEVTFVDLLGKWISYELTRERAERRLRDRNDRLEEFASVVSHDLRDPLSAARGHLKLAREDCESEHHGAIERSLGRMSDLTEDLLALARADERIDETTAVDLDELAARSLRYVDTATATLSSDTGASIRADADRLQRLFENLVGNAVEHGSTSNRPQADDSAERGSAGDRTQFDNSVEHSSTGNRPQADDSVEHGGSGATVRIGLLDSGDGFYVEDDGAGIAEEEREAVLEGGYSTKEEGTGFGLVIADRIAAAHGWELTVTEGTDGGARVELTGVEFLET